MPVSTTNTKATIVGRPLDSSAIAHAALDSGELIASIEKGAAGGVSTLGGDGKIPAGQLANEVVAAAANTAMNIVRPEDFGAKGDGVTDDTAAIQAAINASQVVLFTAGKTYCITQLLVNKNGMSWYCPSSFEAQAYGGGCVLKSLDGSLDMVLISGHTFRPQGLALLGKGTSAESGSDVTQAGFVYQCATKDIDSHVERCGFILLNTGVKANGANLIFKSCIFSSSRFGFMTHMGGGWENRGFLFDENCRFHGIGKPGLHGACIYTPGSHDVQDLIIKTNLADFSAALFDGFASNLKIVGVQVSKGRSIGINIDSTGHTTAPARRTVSLNSFTFHGDEAYSLTTSIPGVAIRGSMRLFVSDVYVAGCGDSGFYCDVPGAVIKGVHVSDAGQRINNTFPAIEIAGAGSIIHDVTAQQSVNGVILANKASYGIRITASATVSGLSAVGSFVTAPYSFPTAQMYGDLPALAGTQPTLDWGTAAPTTGTWATGSVRRNTASGGGGVQGWRCTSGGTPGTWEAISPDSAAVAAVLDGLLNGAAYRRTLASVLAKTPTPAPNAVLRNYVASTAWKTSATTGVQVWTSICWSPALGLFVAVASSGTGNRVMTSPDGVTWTQRTSAVDNNWTSVCWSPELGLFVAVASSGTGNRVMTSPDGVTWTIRTSAADNNWTSICWSPALGLFVAVASSGTGNRVMTSPDGITWTIRTSAVDNNWTSVCWSPERGMFCAVGNTGNVAMTSLDGITWITASLPASNALSSVCWSPELGLFCAVSTNGSTVRAMTSPNGATWTLRTTPSANMTSVCWSPALGLFVAVASSGTGTRVVASPDGVNWTLRTSAADNGWLGVCWSPDLGLFAAVSNNGTDNRVMTSVSSRAFVYRS